MREDRPRVFTPDSVSPQELEQKSRFVETLALFGSGKA